MKTKNYVAIIADIVSSKEIKNRKEVQDKLNKVIDHINMTYAENIASQFVVTLGDEFQGLLFDISRLLEIIDVILFEMYPITLRIGVGIGPITTEIKPEVALGADGPAYHQARNAITYIHDNEMRNATYDTSIVIFPDEKPIVKLINLALLHYSAIFKSWDAHLFDAVRLMLEKKNQLEASQELKVTQSAITKRLKTAHYYNFHHTRAELDKVMKSMDIHEF